MAYATLYLKKGKEKSLNRLHPWVFSGALQTPDPTITEGDIVRLYDSEKQYIASGHYQKSSLAIRILTFMDESIDDAFWYHRIQHAISLRSNLHLLHCEHTTCCRLVHGEGDDLPGLIIDYYEGIAVIQCHSAGMYKALDSICEQLKKILGNKLHSIYNKSENTIPFKSGIEAKDQFLFGNTESITVKENAHLFHVHVVEGQKTGFFIDQRENRTLLASLAKGKKVLNTFCYSGGFSIYALKAGATLVHSVDSSAKAIALTQKNCALNFTDQTPHQAFCSDVMEYMNQCKEVYDIIILDPPAYAKHQNALDHALKGYTRLNRKAFEKVQKQGIVFTFSCSQVVSVADFRTAIFTAALQSGRNIKIIHQLHQPSDHPVSIFHPEGEYLKGFVLFVE